jgi:hypothetical protein
MRFALTTLLLSLVLMGCSRSDQELSQQIVGTWHHDHPGSPGVLTFSSNGGVSSTWQPAHHVAIKWEGTWRITNGVVVVKYTKSNNVPFTGASRGKIIQLDDHILQCEIDYLGNGRISYARSEPSAAHR